MRVVFESMQVAELTDYERERLENIEKNQQMLLHLGLAQASKKEAFATPRPVQVRKQRRVDPPATDRKLRVRAPSPKPQFDVLRTPSPPPKRPKRTPLELRKLRPVAPKAEKSSALEAPVMTAAERSARLVELGAMEWLEAIQEWLLTKNGCSASNAERVLRVLRRLASGEGVAHTQSAGSVFMAGEALRLDADGKKLFAEGVEWVERGGGDPSHGWLLRHPLGKFYSFQESVLSGGPNLAAHLSEE